jgi:hypothetical protein
VAAWALAVAGPALLTLAALPLRSSLVLGGFLFSALLVVIVVAVIGGVWPALTGVVLSVLARVFFFAPPFENRGVDLRPNLVSLIAFVVVGVIVAILIGELTQLAEEQASSRLVEAALRRVATLVAQAAPADELFAAVTEEVGRLLTADFARLARYEPGDSLTVVAAWGRSGDHFPIGSRWPLAGKNVSSFVWQTGRPARIDDFAGVFGPLAVEARERGVRYAAGAPVIVQGRLWGVMIAGSIDERPTSPTVRRQLSLAGEEPARPSRPSATGNVSGGRTSPRSSRSPAVRLGSTATPMPPAHLLRPPARPTSAQQPGHRSSSRAASGAPWSPARSMSIRCPWTPRHAWPRSPSWWRPRSPTPRTSRS